VNSCKKEICNQYGKDFIDNIRTIARIRNKQTHNYLSSCSPSETLNFLESLTFLCEKMNKKLETEGVCEVFYHFTNFKKKDYAILNLDKLDDYFNSFGSGIVCFHHCKNKKRKNSYRGCGVLVFKKFKIALEFIRFCSIKSFDNKQLIIKMQTKDQFGKQCVISACKKRKLGEKNKRKRNEENGQSNKRRKINL